MKYKMNILQALCLVCLNCVPGTDARKNHFLPALMALKPATIPVTREEAVQVQLLDEVFQEQGDYALKTTERDLLIQSMEERYYACLLYTSRCV